MSEKYNHVMIDLETLDTKRSAVVISLGAVKFNLEEEDTWEGIMAEKNERCFHVRFDAEEQVRIGRTISPSTVFWWLDQNKAAQAELLTMPEAVLGFALQDFADWAKRPEFAWGNGNTFDNVILRSLYEDMEMDYPFHYSRDLDVRTAMRLLVGGAKIDTGRTDWTEHNALNDAINQVLYLQRAYAQPRAII